MLAFGWPGTNPVPRRSLGEGGLPLAKAGYPWRSVQVTVRAVCVGEAASVPLVDSLRE